MSARLGPSARRQSGVVLFIALIVLVAMTLAGIAIMRSVDTGVTISGNVAFKQSTLGAADRGIDDAFQFLTSNVGTGVLDGNYAGNAYYAQVSDPANWADDAAWADAKELGKDAAGNDVAYVIHRMCDAAGAYAGVNCVQTPSPANSGANSKSSDPTKCITCTLPPLVYYRVTVRVQGERGTMSIVQSNIGVQH